MVSIGLATSRMPIGTLAPLFQGFLRRLRRNQRIAPAADPITTTGFD